ncbi:MAG: 2-hydroxychromene-2-carboxylate isomerase [Parvibaculum sp.]|uniref:2-hydroxychromene-2-carboxylate isomerase n=1 Tax=Parvibaculum sp. TaxID=2024848 RepID=UPI002722BC2B|nr:2-hydroxychromene-2-carboxylate isomerase [Parvibaculum sp.]MDO8837682.1 2-hydroxychromene-2-carboxylate isomerase [Parvibaculum sp.]
MQVEFWYEFASTYSYPAAMRVERAAAEAGVALAWRPFLLGPIFGAQGWNDSPFNIYPAKGKYMWRDMARICAAEGLTLKTPPARFPQNGLKAARLALIGQDEPWGPEFTRRVYLANFAEQKDISEEGVLAGILDALGLDAAALAARASEPVNKERLKTQTAEAIAKGVFGAPSFVVSGGDELFWGNDRLDAALQWAKR